MKALLFCFVCLMRLSCMPTQSKNTTECIQDLVGQLESKTFVFSELKRSYGFNDDGAEIFQFNLTDAAPCFRDAAFVKSYGQDRLDNISLKLAQGYETTLAALKAGFGEFRMAPADPSGTWSALAKYNTPNEKVDYTIIVEAREKIAPETVIRDISIRLDYQD